MIRRKYVCNECNYAWWNMPGMRSRLCRTCSSEDIEVTDYEYVRMERMSGFYKQLTDF